jgi:3-methyladenine DNA glycosylase Tag
MDATMVGPDGKPRCRWCGAAPEFLEYHDREWGFPVGDDHVEDCVIRAGVERARERFQRPGR